MKKIGSPAETPGFFFASLLFFITCFTSESPVV